MCVQRGPDDSEDRCAYTVYNYKKVFMCFCQGDLCNSSVRYSNVASVLIVSSVTIYLAQNVLLINV